MTGFFYVLAHDSRCFGAGVNSNTKTHKIHKFCIKFIDNSNNLHYTIT